MSSHTRSDTFLHASLPQPVGISLMIQIDYPSVGLVREKRSKNGLFRTDLSASGGSFSDNIMLDLFRKYVSF